MPGKENNDFFLGPPGGSCGMLDNFPCAPFLGELNENGRNRKPKECSDEDAQLCPDDCRSYKKHTHLCCETFPGETDALRFVLLRACYLLPI